MHTEREIECKMKMGEGRRNAFSSLFQISPNNRFLNNTFVRLTRRPSNQKRTINPGHHHSESSAFQQSLSSKDPSWTTRHGLRHTRGYHPSGSSQGKWEVRSGDRHESKERDGRGRVAPRPQVNRDKGKGEERNGRFTSGESIFGREFVS